MRQTVDMIIGVTGLAAVMVVLLVALNRAEMSDEQAAQDHYCEMVEIWDRSKGEYGWPPYRGRELCN